MPGGLSHLRIATGITEQLFENGLQPRVKFEQSASKFRSGQRCSSMHPRQMRDPPVGNLHWRLRIRRRLPVKSALPWVPQSARTAARIRERPAVGQGGEHVLCLDPKIVHDSTGCGTSVSGLNVGWYLAEFRLKWGVVITIQRPVRAGTIASDRGRAASFHLLFSRFDSEIRRTSRLGGLYPTYRLALAYMHQFAHYFRPHLEAVSTPAQSLAIASLAKRLKRPGRCPTKWPTPRFADSYP